MLIFAPQKCLFETQNYMIMKKDKLKHERAKSNIAKPLVIGSCFCGKPAVIHAFDTNFCQQHNDELAKSFEARMNMPDNDFDGGGGA